MTNQKTRTNDTTLLQLGCPSLWQKQSHCFVIKVNFKAKLRKHGTVEPHADSAHRVVLGYSNNWKKVQLVRSCSSPLPVGATRQRQTLLHFKNDSPPPLSGLTFSSYPNPISRIMLPQTDASSLRAASAWGKRSHASRCLYVLFTRRKYATFPPYMFNTAREESCLMAVERNVGTCWPVAMTSSVPACRGRCADFSRFCELGDTASQDLSCPIQM